MARPAAAQSLDAGAPSAGVDRRDALQRVMKELCTYPTVSAEELLGALLALGTEAVTDFVDALDHRAPMAGARLEPWCREGLARALRAIPELALGLKLATGSGVEEVQPTALLAIAVLQAVGGASDLSLLFALAEPETGARRPPRAIARAFEAALSEILGRDGKAYGWIARNFKQMHGALRAGVVRAIGDAEARAGLDLFAELLGHDSNLDLAILTQVNRLAGALGQPFDWSFLLRVRAYLGANDPSLRREAAMAAGRMEDFEAFPELIRMLVDASSGVRAGALWALRSMSGCNLSADHERWQVWYALESTWWRDEAQALLAMLSTGSEAEVIRALGELCSHRLYRHELAKELAWYLGHPDDNLVLAVCSSLATLRSPVVVPELVELLRHRDVQIRTQAWHSLRAITGRDLPLRHQAWSAATQR